MFFVAGMFDREPVVRALQILDADLQLLVNPEAGIVHLAQRYRLLR